ncbi:hypothetical protein GCM10009785_10460 [Brooklawnia cerclae]|uniref:Nucleic acid-binding Zn ribbon protein n=1 Tax=Brooklawnia cerclae TaxID=349934 RepID=A0ABX0SKA3_9ACTN|nr:DciA family protein [Brooklawnia cerclae]NIH58849.1 putative nucleic acid-binding Zn ribbon protein [Brooklawnia cerclae]
MTGRGPEPAPGFEEGVPRESAAPREPSDGVEAEQFPPIVEPSDHDPLGLDVATRIAHDVAGILPAPRGVRPRRRRRSWDDTEQRSGSGPDSRDPQPLGRAFGRLVERKGWQTQLGLRQLLTAWSTLVGPTIAEHTQPEAFRDGVLLVRAESTAWATALRHMAPQLLAKLNHELGDGSVTRVEVHGPAAPSWKHGRLSVRDGRGPRDTYG